MIKKHPCFGMEERDMLSRVDFEHGILILDGQEYPLLGTSFPTVAPESPCTLTRDETAVMDRLRTALWLKGRRTGCLWVIRMWEKN